MRIIRLVSDELQTSRFVKTISAPLMVKPESKIALKSISFDLKKTTTFVIDDDGYYLDFSVGDTDESGYIFYRAQVPLGTYTLTSFINMVQYLINEKLQALTPDENSWGFEWALQLNGNILSMSFNRADLGVINSNNLALTEMIAGANNTYTRSPAALGTGYDSFAQSKLPLCKGGSNASIIIGGNNPLESDFIIGLYNSIVGTSTILLANASVAVFNDGGVYWVRRIDGSDLATDVEIEVADVVRFYKEYDAENNRGRIKCDIIKESGPINVLNDFVTENFVNENQYFTFAIGSNDTGLLELAEPSIIASPFAQSTANGIYSVVPYANNVYQSDITQRLASNVQLVFNSTEMRTFLGYAGITYAENLLSGHFTADYPIGQNGILNDLTEDVVVVLENLPIDGYDFLENKKSAIVAVIPIESLLKNGVNYSYTENFPTYVSLNNKEEQNFNNFYVSVKSGTQYMNVENKIYMQLLLDG